MALLWLYADVTEIKIHSNESNLNLAFFAQAIISLLWKKTEVSISIP